MITITKPILITDLGMHYPNDTSKRKRRYGLYLCECGNEFKARIDSVNECSINSCGCYHKKRVSTHCLTNHRLYDTWKHMINRTTNPKDKNFKDYGERGITVCDRWLDINIFINDMYPTYQDGLTIDRIDNDGNYEPYNCRWATKIVQGRNRKLLMSTNTSGYRGAHFNKSRNKWIAQIKVDGKNKNLVGFKTVIEAAQAYDNYVITNNLEHTKNFS